MTQREQYIKPSVLRLDYSADADVVSFAACKSFSNHDARGVGDPAAGSSCAVSTCQSATVS